MEKRRGENDFVGKKRRGRETVVVFLRFSIGYFNPRSFFNLLFMTVNPLFTPKTLRTPTLAGHQRVCGAGVMDNLSRLKKN